MFTKLKSAVPGAAILMTLLFGAQADAQSIRDNKNLGHFFSNSPSSSVENEGMGDIIDTFKLSDMDRSGYLDSGEYHQYLTGAFRVLLGHNKAVSWDQVLDFMYRDGKSEKDIDADKRSQLRLMFSLVDRDHDDHISAMEIEKTSAMIFDQLDTDNNRELNHAEFSAGPGRLILPVRMTRAEAEPFYSGF